MVENSPTMAFVLSTERKLAMVVKDCVLNRKVYFSGHLKHQPGLSGRRRIIVGIKIEIQPFPYMNKAENVMHRWYFAATHDFSEYIKEVE